MRIFSANIEIDAEPQTIWQILTDAPRYPEWDPGMIKIEGTIAHGQQLTIYTKIAPNRAFKPTVSVFEPPHKMVWQSGMPFGLFLGARTMQLEPLSGGKVRFSLQEAFSGLLLPLIGKTIPDLTPTFEAFCAGLKARAEQK